MQAYTKAYEATEPSVTSAIQEMGEANALAEQVAPADPYLNLASSTSGTPTYQQLNRPGPNLPPASATTSAPKGAGRLGSPVRARLPSPRRERSSRGHRFRYPSAVAPGTGTAPG